MKRPNVARMRKHAARSTPDQVSRYFKQSGYIRGNVDDAEFQKWFEWFKKRMEAKHGVKTGFIDVERHMDHSRFEVLIVLAYKGIDTPYWGALTTTERWHENDVNARMRQILYNGL